MTKLPKSPLAPSRFPNALPVPGVEFAVAESGSRYQGRPDLFAARFSDGTTAAGVFTRSRMPSAPVDYSKTILANGNGHVRGLVVNAGIANAFTGKAGDEAARKTAKGFADSLGISASDIVLASTGVIGDPLDPAPLVASFSALNYAGTGWEKAARAIGTTDTFPKGACEIARIEDQSAVITGIAKGSGMIAPDLATMLAFVFTNAAIDAKVLQALLKETADQSFNCISVDGDTSTSDTVYLIATGEGAKYAPIDRIDDPRLDNFRQQLLTVMKDLAQQIVKDGEGAQKFVTISITGAENDMAARRIGLSIANSPLVKTAIAGEDPNWGRIVMAIGKSGERADRDCLRIRIGDVLVTEGGHRHPAYVEEDAATHMRGQEISISADVGVGNGKAVIWTCDLSHGYIAINADYRS